MKTFQNLTRTQKLSKDEILHKYTIQKLIYKHKTLTFLDNSD